MVAAHFTVIAGDDDKRAPAQSAPLDVVEELTQAVVHLTLRAVVRGPDLPALPLVAGGHLRPRRQGECRQGMEGRLVLGPGAPGERSDLLGVVEIVVADRVAPGRMGADEGRVDEERLIPVRLQPPGHGLADEPGLREVRGEAGRCPCRPVVGCSREVRNGLIEHVRVRRNIEALGGQPCAPRRTSLLPRVFDHGPEPGEDALVREQAGVTRRDRARIDGGIGVPEEDGVVTQVTGQARHIGEAGVEWGAVEHRAVAVLVGAGVQAGPGGTAGRRVGPVIGEENAAPGQGIEGGRAHDGVAECREAVSSPLVDRDEQDVTGRRHAITLADGRRATAPSSGRGASRPATTACFPRAVTMTERPTSKNFSLEV